MRRPRPPRRRRRFRFPRPSESSESAAGNETSSTSSDVVDLADFFTFLGAASTGAAWKIGTGIDADFLLPAFDFVTGVSASTVGLCGESDVDSALSDFLLDFLTARLRGDFGSIAMAPNPLARISAM